MAPPVLPPNLSYKSAVVLMPTSGITGPIQIIRRKHDKNFHRWPPHINLIYPFVASPSNGQAGASETSSQRLRQEILEPLRKVATETSPFRVVLSSKARHFLHSRHSATVWLKPIEREADRASEAGEASQLNDFQKRLQAEFPECNTDQRGFTPHLSIGQCAGQTEAEDLCTEVEGILDDLSKGTEGAIQQPDELHGLEWNIDRVFVIERKGYRDPFDIVGEVLLGHDPSGT